MEANKPNQPTVWASTGFQPGRNFAKDRKKAFQVRYRRLQQEVLPEYPSCYSQEGSHRRQALCRLTFRVFDSVWVKYWYREFLIDLQAHWLWSKIFPAGQSQGQHIALSYYLSRSKLPNSSLIHVRPMKEDIQARNLFNAIFAASDLPNVEMCGPTSLHTTKINLTFASSKIALRTLHN